MASIKYLGFANLGIIDISYNHFNGSLPSDYLEIGVACQKLMIETSRTYAYAYVTRIGNGTRKGPNDLHIY